MKPLDISLMGCPVTDFRTGALLGKIRYVVVNPQDERIQSLALDAAGYDGAHQWIGMRLYNPEGFSLGRVSDVLISSSEHCLVWVEAEPTPQQEVGSIEGEPSELSDYMIGQISLCRLVDEHGKVIIEPGEVVTMGTIKEAKRLGLLHQLATRFP